MGRSQSQAGRRSTGKKGGAGVNTKFSYVNASNSGSDARQAARLTADVVTPRKRATGTPAYARFRTAEPPVDSGVGARGSQRACAGRPGDRPPARLRTPRSLARAPSGGCGRRMRSVSRVFASAAVSSRATNSLQPRMRASAAVGVPACRRARNPAQVPTLRRSPPSWNSVRRPWATPSVTKTRYTDRARGTEGPNWLRIVPMACHGRPTVPTRALCPDHGYRSRARRLGTTPARTGLR